MLGQVAEMAAYNAGCEAAFVDVLKVSVVGPTPSTVMMRVRPSRVPSGTVQPRGPGSGDVAPALLIVTEVAEM